ncbi:MAG: electron transport complex subunit RsxC [Gammaproteobacteria bacterium]|nr:electron transport complex subunit RsxC [Gammaproteobacteria bacterium]
MTEAIQGDGRLAGGIALPARKHLSTAAPIATAPLPSRLVHPLTDMPGRDSRVLVQVGERVLRGTPLSACDETHATVVHAASSGTVRAIEPHPVADLRRSEALCVIIDVDGHDESLPSTPPDPAAWTQDHSIAAALAQAGLAGLGGAVYPTGRKLAEGRRLGLKSLIINGAECEPYISCDDMLMRERADEIIAGTLAMLELTGCPSAIIALEDDKSEALAALEAAVAARQRRDRLAIVTVPTVFPSGGERQLIQLITGEEVPSGGYPPDLGYLCQNVGTAAALARWLATGRPVTSRIVTVTGGGVANPQNLEVRLGTPIADLIAACGGYRDGVVRLIMGGGMTGIALASDEAPVTRASNCIIAATVEELRDEQAPLPCIRCGDCADACPARLMPQLLHWHALREDDAELAGLNLFDCIECGCCDLVCPSHIPLTEQFRGAKRRLWQSRSDEQRARVAERRHEARQQRLATQQAAHHAQLEEVRDSARDPHAASDAIAQIMARAKRDRDSRREDDN